MPSKELIEEIAFIIRHDKDGSPEDTAHDILEVILAALQEPDQSMLGAAEGMCVDGPYLGRLDAELVWGRMLAASALGEHSE